MAVDAQLPVEPPQLLYAQIDFVLEDLCIEPGADGERNPNDQSTLGAKRTLTDTVIAAFLMGVRMESGSHQQPCKSCEWYGESRGVQISAVPKRMWQAINSVTDQIEREDLLKRIMHTLPACRVCMGRCYLTEHQQVERLKAELREAEQVKNTAQTERDRALDDVESLESQLRDAQYDAGERFTLREQRNALLQLVRDHDRGLVTWRDVMDGLARVQWDASDLGDAGPDGAACWRSEQSPSWDSYEKMVGLR